MAGTAPATWRATLRLAVYLMIGALIVQAVLSWISPWSPLAQPVGQLTWAEWQRVDRLRKAKGYPAAHHSAAYTAAHAPAYRVLPAAQARHLLAQLPHPIAVPPVK